MEIYYWECFYCFNTNQPQEHLTCQRCYGTYCLSHQVLFCTHGYHCVNRRFLKCPLCVMVFNWKRLYSHELIHVFPEIITTIVLDYTSSQYKRLFNKPRAKRMFAYENDIDSLRIESLFNEWAYKDNDMQHRTLVTRVEHPIWNGFHPKHFPLKNQQNSISDDCSSELDKSLQKNLLTYDPTKVDELDTRHHQPWNLEQLKFQYSRMNQGLQLDFYSCLGTNHRIVFGHDENHLLSIRILKRNLKYE